MLSEIGSYDAKTRLPEILRRVESGESFTITNRGRAIAELRPSPAAKRQQVESAIQCLFRMQQTHAVSDATLTEMKNTGRK
jgi:prevent-host-death family protein